MITVIIPRTWSWYVQLSFFRSGGQVSSGKLDYPHFLAWPVLGQVWSCWSCFLEEDPGAEVVEVPGVPPFFHRNPFSNIWIMTVIPKNISWYVYYREREQNNSRPWIVLIAQMFTVCSREWTSMNKILRASE